MEGLCHSGALSCRAEDELSADTHRHPLPFCVNPHRRAKETASVMWVNSPRGTHTHSKPQETREPV